jgi:hypothetical protein
MNKHIKLAPSERKFADTEREWRNLLLAVVEQAVDDWRWLCRRKKTHGKRAGCPVSFIELEQFFENDCEYFLRGTGICAPQIYRQLQRERAGLEPIPSASVKQKRKFFKKAV